VRLEKRFERPRVGAAVVSSVHVRLQHGPGKLKSRSCASDLTPLSGMISRRAILTLACVAVAGLIAVGVAQLPRDSTTAGTSAKLTAAQTNALLAGSPPALAGLHKQSGALLEGGARALHARLASLKGYPVVINKWASWCVPCKEEFGAFQHASAEYGRRVAFIGIDSEDPKRTDALAFLKSFPVSYPSYYDSSGALGEQTTGSPFIPVTLFIGRDGHQFPRQGQYPSAAKLEQDIRRYALQG
jgi:cytochrome c biogenesis protein CcmG, thiol:disulfide interchange protein DsbE